MRAFIFILLLHGFLAAHSQKTMLKSLNLKLTLPTGWTIEEDEGGYACYSPNRNNVIIIMEDPDHSIDYYVTALMSGVDIGGGTTIQTNANLVALATASYYCPVWIMTPNGNGKGWGGIKVRKAGGVIGFVAAGPPQNLEDLKSKLLAMISSCEEVSVTLSPEVADKWASILTSSHLEGGYDSYSSGSDGYTSVSTYDFCANGRYKYKHEFNTTLGSPGITTETGVWRVVEDRGSIVLQVMSTNGNNKRFKLSQKDNVIFLNDTRYMKTQYRPACQ